MSKQISSKLKLEGKGRWKSDVFNIDSGKLIVNRKKMKKNENKQGKILYSEGKEEISRIIAIKE